MADTQAESKELQNGSGYEQQEKTEAQPYLDTEMDKRIAKKFDLHILPLLFGMWLLAFIDRSNIGNAKIAGLEEEVAPGTKFNTALAIFYVPYIIVDVPSNWVVKKLKPGYYLSFLLFAWGIVSMCTGFVKTYGGLIAVRFFLGLCEGGLLGGMILYLSMFYRRHQMMYRISLFYCAAPLSGAFGGLLAFGLSQIEVGSYVAWPWIFFVEGAITVVFGVVCFFLLPHSIAEARFLTSEERDAAIDRKRADDHGDKQVSQETAVAEDSFSWHWVKLALLNVNTWLLSWIFFAIITPIYSFSLFLPTIIEVFGYSDAITQVFTIPPNICGFIMVLIVGHFSDRLKVRGPFMLVGCALAVIGYIMLIATPKPFVQWGGTFFIATGIFPCSPLIMAWLSNNLHPHYVRATGTGFQIGVANLGAFIATFTYLEKDFPRYFTGHAINIGMIVLAMILIAIALVYQRWENAKRARGERDYRLNEMSETELGHLHPQFRYTL